MLKNKKILVLSSITTYPVKSGGQMRSHFIIKELAKYNTVKVFVPIARKDDFPKFSTFDVNCGNYTETRYINYFLQGVTFICERFGLFGISFLLLKFSLQRNKTLQTLIEEADVIFLNFPHLGFLIQDSDKEIYYISHNVEYKLISSNMKIGDSKLKTYFIELIKQSEKKLIQLSKKVFACTQQDIGFYISEFQESKEKFCILENGVDKEKIHDAGQKPEIYNGKNNKIIFIGSYFKPNLEAVTIIEQLAQVYREYNFFIAGSVAKGKKSHDNLFYDENSSPHVINTYLKYADYAINPVISGSGSNLKMIDYFYFGIPVISTEVGLRGFEGYSDIVLDENNVESLREVIFNIDNNRDYYINKGKGLAQGFFWEDLVYNKIINASK